ncbi:PGF-pre-PGF domain-containing protein [Methanolobus sp. ZRKC3]|uniref:PGF-pre-PGF domain-containing protein n=1 Tax=Methanolobus sp. ZRKC3 TaxID=3125786 RepID=UPI00325563E2
MLLSTPANASFWHVETVDSGGIVGQYTSLDRDSSDNAAISYFDLTKGDLKYAYYNGSSWELETVDSIGIVGTYASLALDSSDNAAISYGDNTNWDLKYAYYNGISWEVEIIDSTGNVGGHSSLALNSSDNAGISYRDVNNGSLKYAYYNGSGWELETVDSNDHVGEYTSIAFDSSDNAAISYYDNNNDNLKYAYYNGSGWEIETVDSGGLVGSYTSLDFDSSDNAGISYHDSTSDSLKYAYYNGTSWELETVDSNGDVGSYTSLAFDSSDNAGISYHDSDNASLKYAYYNDSGWELETVDSDGVGYYISLAFDDSDNAAISYHDDINDSLKYAIMLDTGILPVNSSVSGAWVYVDGVNQSVQTNTTLTLEVGTYDITVMKNEYETPTNQSVTITEGSNSAIEFSMVAVPPVIDSIASSSSGSSSGTRVSVSQGQDPEIVKSTTSSTIRVIDGAEIEYDFSDGETPVLGISFDAKSYEGLVVAKVQVLSDSPEGVPSPSGNSYQLMSIDVGSEGTISKDNAENILIHFEVSKEWVEENNIDVSTIRMTRYNAEQWQDLPTTQVREDSEFIYFTAETPGFSIFRVVGDEVGETVNQETSVSDTTVEEIRDGEMQVEVESVEVKDTPGFGILAGLVFASFAVLVRRKFD